MCAVPCDVTNGGGAVEVEVEVEAEADGAERGVAMSIS